MRKFKAIFEMFDTHQKPYFNNDISRYNCELLKEKKILMWSQHFFCIPTSRNLWKKYWNNQCKNCAKCAKNGIFLSPLTFEIKEFTAENVEF